MKCLTDKFRHSFFYHEETVERLPGSGGHLYLGQPTDIPSNKKKGMWPSCVERYTPKPVSQ
jgi:hypothetical protein